MDYSRTIIFPFLRKKRLNLGLNEDSKALLISNAFKGKTNEAVRWHSIGLDIFEFTYFGQFSTFVITCQVTELCALFFTHNGACRSRMILTALFTNSLKIL